jgi:hypothetical protein
LGLGWLLLSRVPDHNRQPSAIDLKLKCSVRRLLAPVSPVPHIIVHGSAVHQVLFDASCLTKFRRIMA